MRADFAPLHWREVPGFHDYEISNRGDLRRNGADLKPDARGRYALCKGGITKRMKASQIVEAAFGIELGG